MPKSSHLELHASDSEDLDLLDSLSLPPEPPDIRNWFPSFVYESPELDELDCFEDSDGAGDRCVEEDACAGQVKPSHGIEANGSDDSECCKSAAIVSGMSDSSLSLPAEPPDIRNWFSSYVYESPQLDTALDFAISVCEECEDGKLGVVEKSASQNIKDPMASINGEKTQLCALKNTLDALVKGPNIVNGTKLDYQSVCKDDDVITSLSSSDKVSEAMLSGQKAGYGNYKSLEKSYDDDDDAKLHGTFFSRNPISSSMEKNLGSQDGKSVYRPIKGTGRVKDALGNKDINKIVSPQTIDKIVPKGECRGSQADRRNTGKENETELQEDGFISVRKRSSQENAVNVARLRIKVEPVMNIEKDCNIVRKVSSEISNFQSQNVGKWCCPQKNKPDLGPPLKQLRLDQWVRRV